MMTVDRLQTAVAEQGLSWTGSNHLCRGCGEARWINPGASGTDLCSGCAWRGRVRSACEQGPCSGCGCNRCRTDRNHARLMAEVPPVAQVPPRELPPTRSDTLCGRNRYTSLDAAFSALWAHAEARGYPAATMVVVAHDLCPDLFHIVPRSKAAGFPEVHGA